jgi:hypothetical protein
MCRCVYNRCEPRHVIDTLERDAPRFAFLREQRRNAREARPETLYAREWRDSRCVLGWFTDKQPHRIEPTSYFFFFSERVRIKKGYQT